VTPIAVPEKPSLLARVRHVLGDDRGSVSAEFAMTLPAVGATIVLCIGAITLSAHQLTLTAAAHQLARLEARGESLDGSQLASLGDSITVRRTITGDALCVHLHAKPGQGPLAVIPLSARGCALMSS